MIFGINYSPELTGIGRYTGEMVDWLASNNFHCSVVTSFPYYPNWKIQKPYKGTFYKKEILNNGGIELYRCPLYVPQYPSGLKRMLHEASFFMSSFFLTTYLLFKPKHQYIFCIAPPFHLGFLAIYYRFFKGGKIIYHIQDLQIEAAKDLQMVKSDLIFRILFSMERYVLRKVNFISTISMGMKKKIMDKCAKNIELFPNWVDVARYYPVTDKGPLKGKWGFAKDDKIVLYSGSIGEKQGLESLIEIALRCKDKPHLRFVICGNGPYKQKLEKFAIEQGADNISFLPLQENDVFNDFLNFADVHLVLQKKGASDLVMPSKLTTILSTGSLVIVTAEPNTSLYIDVVENDLGIVIPPENNESLYNAILDACTQDFSIQKLNARNYAELHLNKERIMKKLNTELLQ